MKKKLKTRPGVFPLELENFARSAATAMFLDYDGQIFNHFGTPEEAEDFVKTKHPYLKNRLKFEVIEGEHRQVRMKVIKL